MKKVSKKFGRLKNLPYLCTTFALIKQQESKNRKREPQGLIDREGKRARLRDAFFEVLEQLNKFFPSLRKKRNFKNNTFEIRAKI